MATKEALKFGIVIGCLNCIYFLIAVAIAGKELVDISLMPVKPDFFYLVVIIFSYSVIMVIVSALLAWGALRKNPRLIAPWVILSALAMIVSSVYLMFIGHTIQLWELFSCVTFIASQCVSWYSIYSLWRNMIDNRANNAHSCTE
ncbi:uncharacterized protein LOC106092228 [Stomoxys calcitrans]|uniref:uncharacterized protein LOC106092228 n=1 Tax=Stomoxys calcitrans TaxID=35570 RepID=UPI0027E2A23F|nr:uncharacterized protein LOC106092228 [Stomoxys calcitrans]